MGNCQNAVSIPTFGFEIGRGTTSEQAHAAAPPFQIEPAFAGLRFGFPFLRVSSPVMTLRLNKNDPNCMIQVDNAFGSIISVEDLLL